MASTKGHQEFVKILLENGASQNIKDIFNNEPIHYATDRGQNQCLEILIQHGVYLDATGQNSLTPLQLAINGSHQVTAQLLLHCGTNLNIKDNHGHFPIEQIVANKALDSFKLLAFFNQT